MAVQPGGVLLVERFVTPPDRRLTATNVKDEVGDLLAVRLDSATVWQI
ncbi:hypothetical protein [Micromonospora zamorensis]